MSQPSDRAGSPLPHPVAADAAVADVEAGGTHPVGVLEGLSRVLPVPMEEADAAEVSPDADAVAGSAHRLHVGSLLTALVASGTALGINLGGDTYITSAKLLGFRTPSPLCSICY